MAIYHDSFEYQIELLENFNFFFVVSENLKHLRPEGKVGTKKTKSDIWYFIIFIFLFVFD